MIEDIAVVNVVTPEREGAAASLSAEINAEHERAFGKAREEAAA